MSIFVSTKSSQNIDENVGRKIFAARLFSRNFDAYSIGEIFHLNEF